MEPVDCRRDAAARTAVEGEEDEETEDDEEEREVGEGITVTGGGWRVRGLVFEGLRPVIGCVISGVTEPAARVLLFDVIP